MVYNGQQPVDAHVMVLPGFTLCMSALLVMLAVRRAQRLRDRRVSHHNAERVGGEGKHPHVASTTHARGEFHFLRERLHGIQRIHQGVQKQMDAAFEGAVKGVYTGVGASTKAASAATRIAQNGASAASRIAQDGLVSTNESMQTSMKRLVGKAPIPGSLPQEMQEEKAAGAEDENQNDHAALTEGGDGDEDGNREDREYEVGGGIDMDIEEKKEHKDRANLAVRLHCTSRTPTLHAAPIHVIL